MSKIVSTGSYVPEKVLTNFDLEKMVDTSDEWIVTRTGIKERRIASAQQATSDLAIEAGKQALERAGCSKKEVDLLIIATITPDMSFPSTACIVQHKLGLKQIAAFDLSAACTGFIYSLATADALINSGAYKCALVIASETLTRITDWQDRSSCVLFGDGAGACVLRPGPDNGGFIGFDLHTDGKYGDLLYQPAGGSRLPASHETVDARQHTIQMKGNEVFKVSINSMANSAKSLLDKHGVRSEDVALVIPHQANLRIIRGLAKKLTVPMDRVAVNIDRYGNMSAATVAVALDESVQSGRVQQGDLILLVAFGGGFTWGSTLIRL
jgi:3-oxoacyl-[acyl-carrier-protein] synthase-3